MIRSEIIDQFRRENPEITSRVLTDDSLYAMCKLGDKNFCAITRCIVDQDGTTISTSENDQYFDLEAEIDNFYDIDDWPGSGVLYNNKALTKTTMGELDMESPTWRDWDSGTPKKWYRRGKYLYLDKPIDSAADDLIIYAVLISDDWDSDVAPYNQLGHLEPYHEAMVLYLTKRAKAKIGKGDEAKNANTEYLDYCRWAKTQIGGNKSGSIFFRKRI